MKHIGKYEIIGLLGRGGMGQVFKVRLPQVRKVLALKLLRPTEELLAVAGEAELRRLFLHEARIMAGLRHPHIAQLWDYDEHQGRPFYTMEYACENLGAAIGESYRAEDPTRRLWPEKALRHTLETLDGLARLHHAGIVHRDIKPFNLLLTPEHRVKLIDFGLSRLRGERDSLHNPPPLPRAVKIGTPYYTAPEQEREPDSVDGRADLYSVGVLCYRLLCGQLPPLPFRELPESFPLAGAFWAPFFRQALAEEREARFPDAPAMAAELRRLARLWREEQDSVCRLPAEEFTTPCPVDEPSMGQRLRATPLKTGPVSAARAFGLDALDRPCLPREVRLEIPPGRPELVRDATHGLLWQRAGSPYPLEREQALAWVAQLNEQGYAGERAWRLPTVEELLPLLRAPERESRPCVPELFAPEQRILWSADRRSFAAGWTLNTTPGFVGWQDFTCPAWVRAVCGKE